ncbi:MAG: homoserine kinase [Halanaerobiales bacterium]|nr:homoserine kinase [Halanaerobiales bacterium]
MIEVRVPGTSANVGPGFDCLGIALNLYNQFIFEEIEDGLVFEGCDQEFANENNLIYVSMKRCFEKIGYHQKGLKIKIVNKIPISRGLGSSATCILGGIMGANEIAGGVLSKDEILNLAVEIEGHPDNITPALFGAMTVAILEDDQVYYSKIKVEGLKFYALIPDFKLSTEESRAVLPKEIPYKDGVFNIGRVSLMISALVNRQFDLIKLACKDKLHQRYRGRLIKDYDQIIKECENLNSLGVYLSGAGPTIMAILDEKDDMFYRYIGQFLSKLNNRWEVKELLIDYEGAVVKKS